MTTVSRIVPCIWFDGRVEEAAALYTGIFPDSRITRITRYPDAAQEVHGHKAGDPMTVDLTIAGTPFTLLNGGPMFKLTEAVSFQVLCKDQAEVDFYWERLGEGGDPAAQQCGWLKDRFGVSWQVVPEQMDAIFASDDPAAASRVMQAMMPMTKLDIAALERARVGDDTEVTA